MIREHFESLPSTQEYAKTKVAHLTTDDWWVFTADEQTQGRATKERVWQSPPNVNLYATFLFRMPKHKSQLLFHMPQVATYSVLLTLVQFGFQPRIKWINDVLLNQKKVCGVLCESIVGADPHHIPVLLGVGLNVNMTAEFCAQIEQPVTSLFVESGQMFDKEEILPVLQQHLKAQISLLIEHGFYDSMANKIKEMTCIICLK